MSLQITKGMANTEGRIVMIRREHFWNCKQEEETQNFARLSRQIRQGTQLEMGLTK